MPRILHIINSLGLGGAEVMLLDIIKNSNRDEFDYHILAPMGKGELDQRAESFEIPVHYLSEKNRTGRIGLLCDGIKLIKRLKPDLIITHTRFSDLLGLYGGMRAGVRARIMTVHAAGMYFLDSSPFHEGLIEYIVSRYAVHYVAVSNAVVGYLQKYGSIPFGKITLIHNGIDPERICRTDIRNRDDVRESLGFEKHHFIVISVGRLIPVKGFEILLREFSAFSKKAPDARLLIVGYGPEEDKIRKTIGDLKLNDRIKIIGRYEKLAELHNASDCFVMTSRQEGFGLAILEAMACGLPVIGSNVGAVPEMIEDRVNGLIFSTKNDGELASCISKIYENRNGAKSMGNLARKTALEKYHIKNTSKKYEELYRRLL